jgi:hypothetical protein
MTDAAMSGGHGFGGASKMLPPAQPSGTLAPKATRIRTLLTFAYYKGTI